MADTESISLLAEQVRTRKRSATEIVRECLDRIDRTDGSIQAFHEICRDHALAAASAVDQRIAIGEDPGLLAGIPIALKDNIVTDFGRTTCGSRMLRDFRSPYSATAVQRLMNAGAIMIGKTRCDEFAMGSSTESCAWGPVRNPWDTRRVPGGSSGGSAAAVAAGMVPAALGSDTGGSIRQPASMCGVIGVKPSFGRVSRYGLVAFGSSLDQIGPFARSVSDAALLLRVIAGVDAHDSTSTDMAVTDYLADLENPIADLWIGVPRQYLSDDNHPDVNRVMAAAIDVYRRLGATIVDVDLPLTEYGIATYYIIAPAEASSNLARFDGIRYGHRAQLSSDDDLFELFARSRSEGFGAEVQRRIMLGTYVLSAGYYDAYYKRALQVRRLIKREFDAAFEQCHVLLGPTSPIPAFRLGEKSDPLSMYLCDAYTVNANIAGICGLSMNAGFARVDDIDLPVGLQLQCRAFDESTLFRAARMFEANDDAPSRRPPVHSCLG